MQDHMVYLLRDTSNNIDTTLILWYKRVQRLTYYAPKIGPTYILSYLYIIVMPLAHQADHLQKQFKMSPTLKRKLLQRLIDHAH